MPLNHEHKDQEIMSQKVKRHIEPPIDLSEMETSNMVKILEILIMRWLKLLAEKLEGSEKEIYCKALFDMRSPDVDESRLREAEAFVMKIVDYFGKLILIGDQLTVILLSIIQE